MKRKIIPVLIGCTLSFSALAAQPTAERYVVSFPEGTHVNYAGAFASAFPNGLPVGIGSGLLFTGKQGDALTFATITDRGPNADSPKEGKNETKIFVTPDFAPLLMTIRVQNGKAEAIDPRPLHDDKGAINGLPLASDVIGSTNEVAFSDTLHRLKGDNRGLDTEGITPDGKGGYWLCDEYGPFLINIDSKGKILAIHGPQAAEGEKAIAGGLPNILKWRHPTSQRIALFLKPVQIGFHLCDTAGDFFGTTAEVHPAEFIQLRLQMVYFALSVAQLFLQGVDQRFLFGQALF